MLTPCFPLQLKMCNFNMFILYLPLDDTGKERDVAVVSGPEQALDKSLRIE